MVRVASQFPLPCQCSFHINMMRIYESIAFVRFYASKQSRIKIVIIIFFILLGFHWLHILQRVEGLRALASFA